MIEKLLEDVENQDNMTLGTLCLQKGSYPKIGGQSWHQHIIAISCKYGTSYLGLSTILE